MKFVMDNIEKDVGIFIKCYLKSQVYLVFNISQAQMSAHRLEYEYSHHPSLFLVI